MTSSATKNTVPRASSLQPPDSLLALLTACFSILASGKGGEATFSDQVSNLLQDKVMSVEELKLLYTYRFGFGINDALNFLGVHSDLKDYFAQQKRFSMHDGYVSLVSSDTEEATTDNDRLPINFGYDGDDEMASDAESNSTSEDEEVDNNLVPSAMPWKQLGGRISAALCTTIDDEVDDTSAPIAAPWVEVGTRIGATLRATCNEGSDDTPGHVVGPWMTVGTRIGAALVEASNEDFDKTIVPMPWMTVGARIGVALHAAGNEDVEDVPCVEVEVPWKAIGARIGDALSANINEEVDSIASSVAVPWKVVGARIGAALRAAATEELDNTSLAIAVPWKTLGARVAVALRAAVDEEVDDVPSLPSAILEQASGARVVAEPCPSDHGGVDNSAAHAAHAWRVVGARVGVAFRAVANEEVEVTPRPFAIPWKVVGARISAALNAASDEEVDECCQNSARCRDDETESTADSGSCLFDADSDSDCVANRVC